MSITSVAWRAELMFMLMLHPLTTPTPRKQEAKGPRQMTSCTSAGGQRSWHESADCREITDLSSHYQIQDPRSQPAATYANKAKPALIERLRKFLSVARSLLLAHVAPKKRLNLGTNYEKHRTEMKLKVTLAATSTIRSFVSSDLHPYVYSI